MVAETFLFGFLPSRWAIVCCHMCRIWGLYCCGGGTALSCACPVVPSHFYSSEAYTGIQTQVPQSPGSKPHPTSITAGKQTTYETTETSLETSPYPEQGVCVLERARESYSQSESMDWVNSEPVNPAVASKMSLSPETSNREPPH